jgi:glucose-1-phosphate cytidylyltransferase
MKVVIRCGGVGTRLREETGYRPKPMVNIGAHPSLWHIMKYYSQFCFHDFVLALGYKGEMISLLLSQMHRPTNRGNIYPVVTLPLSAKKR